ncbi:MAG: peptidase C1, partial [Burkholderiales bacterium]|nr:peptidase C1 [Burkholderiales bacterium]
MPAILRRGDQGPDVDRLATALRRELGADATWFPTLARRRAPIDEGFDAAIRRWQAGVGVIADGLVGPRCQVLLGLMEPPGDRFQETPLSVSAVTRLFPATKPANVARYLPYIEAALAAAGLTDRAMVVAALGTIRAETEGFVPIAELPSKFNTPAGGAPFSAYEGRRALGNRQAGDGARFRGRGFVQLTGRANYTRLGEHTGLPLTDTPDLANAPEVAAVLLAAFLAGQADRLRAAFERADWAAARRAVNGGTHGLDRFKDVVRLAADVWPARPAARRPAAAAGAVGAVGAAGAA